MRVLLTNDDGVDADGILAIRSALAAVSATVITIAPEPGRAARLAARLGAGLGRRSRGALALPVRRAG